MIKLFLDDVRDPLDCIHYIKRFGIRPDLYLGDWKIIRNYDEFVKWIEENGIPSIISFDHDLADEHYDIDAMYAEDGSYNKLYDTFKEKTGYDAAKWLKEYCFQSNFKLPICVCHSMNPVGRENINSLFN